MFVSWPQAAQNFRGCTTNACAQFRQWAALKPCGAGAAAGTCVGGN